MCASAPSAGTHSAAEPHCRKILGGGRGTCEEVDAVVDLFLVQGIPQEVVAFEVLIGVRQDDCVLECDGRGCRGVVVDDLDMKITHVIRGDDHVNNTPRQINIMQALGGTPPTYAHLPTVLNDAGEKMSKRNGAMSVRDYQKAGYLPEAILNYLARLGWSHGDAEVFTKEQFVDWFDLESLGRSPAQHNPEKLLWLNHQYIQNADPVQLALAIKPFAHELGIDTERGPDFVQVVALLKDRANTLIEIAEGAKLFYLPAPNLSAEQIKENIPEAIVPALKDLVDAVTLAEPSKAAYSAIFKEVLAKHQLKMPALAMPVRYALFATTQTPAIDSVLVVLGKEEAISRLSKVIQ